ncbi:hypothetical protein DMB66_21350 [Actinoplanes sp. ATCC 53533]|uniref:hypothetical protein n=1 Tax=Actinoplanes sp. ATCC 53533 TaxID=1288362 RepID=UPI000F76E2A0|nr:hypothetical protein [Actinoplanes sp. ATCC 53533]RSM64058.1 hypothetical protein DMB66_21350 [Actinoplanes sp. ATCC 53533]
MPTTDANRIPAPTTDATAAHHGDKDDTPWSFPVTIVRPATTPLPPLTAVQRDRRRAASRLAAELTDTTPRRRRRVRHPDFNAANCLLPWPVTGRQIIHDAPHVAAAPPPGAVQVGTDDHRRPVAVVLHADRWSLVLHAARIRTYGWQPPMSWVFLDRPDDPDWYDEFGVDYLTDSFDPVYGVDTVEWTHMVTTVLALTTAPAHATRPPHAAHRA